VHWFEIGSKISRSDPDERRLKRLLNMGVDFREKGFCSSTMIDRAPAPTPIAPKDGAPT